MSNILKKIIPDIVENIKKYGNKSIMTPFEIRKKRDIRYQNAPDLKINIDPITKQPLLLKLPPKQLSKKDNKTYNSIIDKIDKLKNKIILKKNKKVKAKKVVVQ